MSQDDQNNAKQAEPPQKVDWEKVFQNSTWNLTLYLIETDPDLKSGLSREKKAAITKMLREKIRSDFDGWVFLRVADLRRKPRSQKGENGQ